MATESGFTEEGGAEQILKESAQVSSQAAAIAIASLSGKQAKLSLNADI